MCGIAGIVSTRGADISAQQRRCVDLMIQALHHRGPDGQGEHFSGPACFGHARLSIIDLTGGRQPLLSKSGQHALVANGEVYDYQASRIELSRRHEFLTESDSEVLLHSYVENGDEFADSINGMFAYAIHDMVRRRVVIGVDAMGIKPLYFSEAVPGLLLFASELRALSVGLFNLGYTVKPNRAAIADYLRTGWIGFPDTGLAHVHRLAPGEQILIDEQGIKRRGLPARVLVDTSACSEEDLGLRLDQAVKRQVVADVPVGVFLSGGIDSSLLTALCARHLSSLQTFTIRFSGGAEAARVNEADIARRVADHVGAQHHELELDQASLFDHLDEALDAQDELVADPAVLPLLLLSRFARERAKVCLSGDGGDELFGGYLRHIYWRTRHRLSRVPVPIQQLLRRGVGLLPKTANGGLSGRLKQAASLSRFLLDSNYISGPFADYQSASAQMGLPSKHEEIFALERIGPLAAHMLTKTDRIAMSASLEVRVPLLDMEVVRASNAMPWSAKVEGGTGKMALRRFAAKLLPDEIVRLPKRGFRVPISDWFRTDQGEQLQSRLLDTHPMVNEFVDRNEIQALLSEHRQGRADNAGKLWSLLVLERWCQRHFAG